MKIYSKTGYNTTDKQTTICLSVSQGAFFVSSGILFYLYLADVSVPLLGTSFVETPQISGGRSIVHFILFLL